MISEDNPIADTDVKEETEGSLHTVPQTAARLLTPAGPERASWHCFILFHFILNVLGVLHSS